MAHAIIWHVAAAAAAKREGVHAVMVTRNGRTGDRNKVIENRRGQNEKVNDGREMADV